MDLATICSWLSKWSWVLKSVALGQWWDCGTDGKKRTILTRKAKTKTVNYFSSVLCKECKSRKTKVRLPLFATSFLYQMGEKTHQHCPRYGLRWNLDLLPFIKFNTQIHWQKDVCVLTCLSNLIWWASAYHMGIFWVSTSFLSTLPPRLGQKWEKQRPNMNLVANTRIHSQGEDKGTHTNSSWNSHIKKTTIQ